MSQGSELERRRHISAELLSRGVDMLRTSVFDCPLFSPDVIIPYENLDTDR